MRKSPRRTLRSSASRVRSPPESGMGCRGRGATPGDCALSRSRPEYRRLRGAGTPDEYLQGAPHAAGPAAPASASSEPSARVPHPAAAGRADHSLDLFQIETVVRVVTFRPEDPPPEPSARCSAPRPHQKVNAAIAVALPISINCNPWPMLNTSTSTSISGSMGSRPQARRAADDARVLQASTESRSALEEVGQHWREDVVGDPVPRTGQAAAGAVG
jgi:hypothetical protein